MSPRHHPSTTRPYQPYLARTLVSVLAVGIALAIWALASHGLDIEVRSPQMGDNAPADIGPLQVTVASLGAALAGWASLAALERLTPRARTIWTPIAGLVAALSLGAPLTGEGITGSNQVVLVVLHLAVAAVVIPGMLATARRDDDRDRTDPPDHDQEPTS